MNHDSALSGAAAAVVFPTLIVGIIFSIWFNIKIWPLAWRQVRESREAMTQRELAKLQRERRQRGESLSAERSPGLQAGGRNEHG